MKKLTCDLVSENHAHNTDRNIFSGLVGALFIEHFGSYTAVQLHLLPIQCKDRSFYKQYNNILGQKQSSFFIRYVA